MSALDRVVVQRTTNMLTGVVAVSRRLRKSVVRNIYYVID